MPENELEKLDAALQSLGLVPQEVLTSKDGEVIGYTVVATTGEEVAELTRRTHSIDRVVYPHPLDNNRWMVLLQS